MMSTRFQRYNARCESLLITEATWWEKLPRITVYYIFVVEKLSKSMILTSSYKKLLVSGDNNVVEAFPRHQNCNNSWLLIEQTALFPAIG